MKRNMGKICLWKIPAILAVFGLALAFAGCDNGNGGGSSYELGHLGNTLNLSGQVYVWGGTEFESTFTRYNGNRTIPAVTWVDDWTREVVLGSATIGNGQLSLNMGTPTAGLVSSGEFLEGNEYIRINPAAARFAQFWLETSTVEVIRGNLTILGDENGGNRTFTQVWYIYVDRDVNVSRERSVDSDTSGL